jgi:hypothetical protein
VSAFVYIANDASNNNIGNNIQMYNNTLVNMQGLWSGMFIQKGTNNVIRNNLWYNSTRTNNNFGTNSTISHNWYYNTPVDGDSSPSKVVCTTNCNVFKDVNNRDFHLTQSLPAGYSLPAPFTVDQDGVTRAITGNWDRGAYQYTGTVMSPASRPRYLNAH